MKQYFEALSQNEWVANSFFLDFVGNSLVSGVRAFKDFGISDLFGACDFEFGLF